MLVVEDCVDTKRLIALLIKDSVGEIVCAENGFVAVRTVVEAEKSSEPIDLILMDMQMPVMNGFQAAKLLRQRGFYKPIVALTSHNLQGDRERCLEAGCSVFLSKPINRTKLISTIVEL